jgi:lysine 6-dehydrogenase
MHCAVVGCGRTGTAAAIGLAARPETLRLTLLDRDQDCVAKLSARLARSRVSTRGRVFDVADTTRLVDAIEDVDLLAVAGSWEMTECTIEAAIARTVPLVSIARPPGDPTALLQDRSQASLPPLLLACGLEPGMTEILARQAVTRIPRASLVRIRCGGVPAAPVPPLGHIALFGARLSLADRATYAIRDGNLCTVRRFSDPEQIDVDSVGRLEAFHDGMLPWLADDPFIGAVTTVTQKTLRWPGFAARVRLLHDLGMLAETPTHVGGVAITPRDLFDAAMEPVTTSWAGEDVTVLQVEARAADPEGDCVKLQMIHRGDDATGLTSVASTTGFTLAVCAALLARGDIQGTGWLRPERVVTGTTLRRLLTGLARLGPIVRVAVERRASMSASVSGA